MKAIKTMAWVALAGTMSLGVAGCNPRMMGNLLGLAIVTAAIVGTAQVLAMHDGHYHDEYCGHHRRYHEGHWVYNYNGQWEYNEGSNWYSYGGGAPQPPPPPGAY